MTDTASQKPIMIYGATGYTGQLVAKEAARQGENVILAGRNADKVRAVAEPLGLPHRAFDLSDHQNIVSNIADCAVVLHIAGPFSATSAPMVKACIEAKAHYLDITGEIAVFENCATQDQAAKDAGIMVMPGTGFDVIPSDCLAKYVGEQMPDATDLKIFISGLGGASQGTMKSGVESLGKKTLVRRGGKIVETEYLSAQRDFGQGTKDCAAISWGDVSTAYYSTGIPDIEVYFEAQGPIASMSKLGPVSRSVLRRKFVQNLLKKQIDKMPAGPTDEERAAGYTVLLGEATNAKGEKFTARLTTPDGYTLTMLSGLEVAKRARAGEFNPGFQTPSNVYGADFILDFDNTKREIPNQ
ncbi:MAG: saccharopine dehydrogenase NADP-binding domain-containing protein [Alphaproteobacteria bacterium]